MFKPALSLRCVALATASALALAAAPSARSAPPPIPPRIDPPARVARLARTSGTVSFHTADADQWSPATVNGPIIAGDALWTEPGARADVQLTTNRIAMAPTTELDVAALDDQVLATSEPQGEIYLNLRQLLPGDHYTVQTPRCVVEITAAGRYGVVAGDADHPTVVTVIDGAAAITGPGLSLQVGPRQTATLTGSSPVQGSIGPMAQDQFLTMVLAEEKPAPRSTVAIPPVVQQMTGADDLDEQGQWQDTPQYGAVWYPPVEAGWVPYRQGHWAYVAPWGWTWIDDAAWGFAPFHYGRWAQVDNRWGWIPMSPGAAAANPVYAPALVSFLAIGAAVGAIGGRSIAWVPLGPREPYYPPYRANLAYIRGLNATSVPNVNQVITASIGVNHLNAMNNFADRGAATIVPAAAMIGSAPIGVVARPLPAAQFAGVRAETGLPVRPGPTTTGVTPAIGRQFNFIPPARPAQAVPGPAIGRTEPRSARPAIAAAAPPVAKPEPPHRGAAPGGTPAPVASSGGPVRPEARPLLPAIRPQAAAPQPGVRPAGRPISRPPVAEHASPQAPHLPPAARPTAPVARPAPPRPLAPPRSVPPARPAGPPRAAVSAHPAGPPHPPGERRP